MPVKRKLIVEGAQIAYELPPRVKSLLSELRARKPEVIEILRERLAVEHVQRFGEPHTRLFLYIGRKVRTPAGAGALLQVFAERVTVLLDENLNKCSFFRRRRFSR